MISRSYGQVAQNGDYVNFRHRHGSRGKHLKSLAVHGRGPAKKNPFSGVTSTPPHPPSPSNGAPRIKSATSYAKSVSGKIGPFVCAQEVSA